MSKTLILIRHAHRDKLWGSKADNGLSKKGRRQAARVARYFEQIYDAKHRPYLLSSPKLRCVQTLEPMARKHRLKIRESDWLNEQGYADPKETMTAVRRRVRKFGAWWRTKGPLLTVICSHGDWLPVCLDELVGAPVELDKGGWAEVTREGARNKLRWVIQNFER